MRSYCAHSRSAAQRVGPCYRCEASFPSVATPGATRASPSCFRTASSPWRTLLCGSTVTLQRVLLTHSPQPTALTSALALALALAPALALALALALAPILALILALILPLLLARQAPAAHLTG
jgi:hypothetical protein